MLKSERTDRGDHQVARPCVRELQRTAAARPTPCKTAHFGPALWGRSAASPASIL